MKKRYLFLLLLVTLLVNINIVKADFCYEVVNLNTGEITYSSDENLKSHGYGDENVYKLTPYNNSCDELEKKNNGKTNFYNKVSCGNMGSFNRKLPEITSWIVTVAEILVPVILVIFGSIDFIKGIISQKEDEIKKGQQVFIKRLITAVIVFFIVVFTKLIISAVSGSGEKTGLIDCIDCFISNKCS